MTVPEERVIREEFTEEFLREFAGVEDEKARELLTVAAERLEDSYATVAWVSGHHRSTPGYVVEAVPKHTAERGEIKRGMQAIYHWIDKDDA